MQVNEIPIQDLKEKTNSWIEIGQVTMADLESKEVPTVIIYD